MRAADALDLRLRVAERRHGRDARHLRHRRPDRGRDRREAVVVEHRDVAGERAVDQVSIEARRPLANTVTKTTSASPIISAAEVTAVRPGWRVEFSRASRPDELRRALDRRTPTSRAAGRDEARRDHRDAEDQDHRAAGRAEQLRRGVAALGEQARDDEPGAERAPAARRATA